MTDARFAHPTYLLRRKVLKILGGEFRIFDPHGDLAFFARQRFKLKEDIRLYSDESMSQEVLTIAARSVLDISAHYDVTDPVRGEPVGTLQRRGLKAVVRDRWLLFDVHGNQIGDVQEESMALALVRRLALGSLLPQTHEVKVGERTVARFKQRFNPFVQQVDLDFSADTGGSLDRRLGLAAAVLLCAVEGRQGG